MIVDQTYPDRYVITATVEKGKEKGKRVWLYFDREGGGWWQWSDNEAGAHRFEAKQGDRYEDALRCAPKSGPWYYSPDPATVEVKAVPAIVEIIVR